MAARKDASSSTICTNPCTGLSQIGGLTASGNCNLSMLILWVLLGRTGAIAICSAVPCALQREASPSVAPAVDEGLKADALPGVLSSSSPDTQRRLVSYLGRAPPHQRFAHHRGRGQDARWCRPARRGTATQRLAMKAIIAAGRSALFKAEEDRGTIPLGAWPGLTRCHACGTARAETRRIVGRGLRLTWGSSPQVIGYRIGKAAGGPREYRCPVLGLVRVASAKLSWSRRSGV